MIKAVGDKFYVLDSTGKKVLGKHSSKKKAVAQLQAIEISKHERNESRVIKFSDFLKEELKSTLQYHEELNPSIWDGFELKDDVRNKLIEIGQTWVTWANIPIEAVKEMILVGGNANYNYTPHSDIDLHILVDIDAIPNCPDFIDDYLKGLEDTYMNYLKQLRGQAVLLIDTNELDFVENEADYQKLLNLVSQQYAPELHRFG